MWLITLFAHMFANTGYNVILRFAASDKKIDPFWLAAIMQTSIALPGLAGIFIFRINWHLIDKNILPFYICVIFLATTVMVLNAKALEHTEASVFIFLYNFRIGFATLFGIAFLGEDIVPLRIIGGVLIFVSGLIIAGKAKAAPLGLFFSVACAAVMATLNAFEKYMIAEVGFVTYMFPVTIGACIVMWIFILISKREIDISFLKTRGCGWLMVSRAVSAYGLTLSFALGAILSITTYISSLTTVTIPIAAILFLKETSGLKRKTIAGIVALAGVTLIFLAAR